MIQFVSAKRENLYQKLRENKAYIYTYVFLTIWSLLCQDVKQIFSVPAYDFYFDVISLVAIGVFLFEIFLRIYVDQKYWFSLLIFFDFAGVISMVFVLSFVTNFINTQITFNMYGLLAWGVQLILLLKGIQTEIDVLNKSILNANKDNQNLYQRYKENYWQFLIKENFLEEELVLDKRRFPQQQQKVQRIMHNENLLKSSEELLEIFQLRILFVTLLVVILVPIFRLQSYYTEMKSEQTDLNYFKFIYNNGLVSQFQQEFINNYLEQNKTNKVYQIVYFKIYQVQNQKEIPTYSYYDFKSKDQQFRSYEIRFHQQKSNNGYIIESFLQRRKYLIRDSLLNILKTITVLCVYFFSYFWLSFDFYLLISWYFKNMVEIIKQFSLNPFKLTRGFLKQQIIQMNEQNEIDQIQYIQKTLCYSIILFKMGIGEAGESLIQQSLVNNQINALIPGRKIQGIFCFILLEDFTDKIDMLEEEILLYTNIICQLIHQIVVQNEGIINKNLGEALLIVWRIDDQQEKQFVIQRALLCCVQIIIELKQYKGKTKFRNLIQDQVIRIGMHCDWAIEGSIGSQYKIDLSYLSPHVNIASRLASISKFYGQQLLLSQNLFDQLYGSIQKEFRVLDNVVLKGVKNPYRIYAYDLDFSQQQKGVFDWIKTYMRRKSLIQNQNENEVWTCDYLQQFWLRFVKYNWEFLNKWQQFYDIYQQGNWCLIDQNLFSVLQQDFAYKNILSYIRDYKKGQEQWKGYRKLTSK